MSKYLPDQFEDKWIKEWDINKVYSTHDSSLKTDDSKKMYCLSMFPYPSGVGLHVGHVRIYTGTDVLARFFRMNGYNVLHPMGWDAFGLPAENAAIKAKKNPMDMVPHNIEIFKGQMKRLGLSYDWDREFATTDPTYYRWTQWLFIQFFKMGLLYKKNTPINFCPSCKTGLAEEEVLSDGTHERCGKKIEKKELPQWIFKITAYADRLLEDLKLLDWPKGILEMQRNWIGKDKGLNIHFNVILAIRQLAESPESQGDPGQVLRIGGQARMTKNTITVWTKYWETAFGVTFLVVAPEYEWLQQLIKDKKVPEEVKQYVKDAMSKSHDQRMKVEKDKTGVFTGYYAVNPVNGEKVPIWVADYVLANVGTGAVMGVPSHDGRDFLFAKKYHLPLVQVVSYPDKNIDNKVKNGEASHEGEGTLVNSGEFNGLAAWGDGKAKMAEWMIEKKYAEWKTTYHLRDWIFSRQRYWGEPIPMIFCTICAENQSQKSKVKNQNGMHGWYPVPENELPLKLPYVKSYEPADTGESPLSKIKEFVETTCPECGGPARRETDTMPNWAGSCWYFIRFAQDQKSNIKYQSLKEEWLAGRSSNGVKSEGWPVDWYLGGAEHAVLHLLYARFWVKALQDIGLLDFSEPFKRLRNVGMVLAEDHRKMSKSIGNVINPDDVVKEYGADTLRIYEMFMAPFNQEIAWSTAALQGSYRFVKRIWEIYQQYSVILAIRQLAESPESHRDPGQVLQIGGQARMTKDIKEDKQLVAKLQKTIKKVTEDIQQTKYNTSIATMMEFLNSWSSSASLSVRATADKESVLSIKDAKKFLQLLAPFTPFVAEEIWQTVFGEKISIHLSSWPQVDESAFIQESIIIPVQVNGKLRGTIMLDASDISEKTAVAKALSTEAVAKYLSGEKYKTIYVKGKILNFIVS